MALFCYGIRNQYPDPEDLKRRIATTTMIVALFVGVLPFVCSLPQAAQN